MQLSIEVIIAIVSFILGLLGYGVISKLRLGLGYVAKGLRTIQHYLGWGVKFTGVLARLLENINNALEDGRIDKSELVMIEANIEMLERLITNLLNEIERFKQNAEYIRSKDSKS